MKITDQDKERMRDQKDVTGLRTAIPDARTRTAPLYMAEYGIRTDDSAGVIHVFANEPDSKKHGALRDSLDTGLLDTLGSFEHTAEFIPDLNSYCIIIPGLGRTLAPDHVFDRFFKAVDAHGPAQTGPLR
jgi:hypothetical protein